MRFHSVVKTPWNFNGYYRYISPVEITFTYLVVWHVTSIYAATTHPPTIVLSKLMVLKMESKWCTAPADTITAIIDS